MEVGVRNPDKAPNLAAWTIRVRVSMMVERSLSQTDRSPLYFRFETQSEIWPRDERKAGFLYLPAVVVLPQLQHPARDSSLRVAAGPDGDLRRERDG